MEEIARRLELTEREVHLVKHRIQALENEKLPQRVANLEPIVRRIEESTTSIEDKLDSGLSSIREELAGQRALQKGIVLAVAAVVGLIQLIPTLRSLLP